MGSQDVKSLLNCRLVCKNWKLAVDYSPKVMARLMFNVKDWRLLKDSTIIDSIKWIRINMPWKSNIETEDWLQFCSRIGQAVQKIKVDLKYDANDTQFPLVINSVVDSCLGLTELHITEEILELLKKPKYENMQTLVLRTKTLNSFRKILYRFPKLTRIELPFVRLYTNHFEILFEYINNGGVLKVRNRQVYEYLFNHDISRNTL